MPVQNPVAIVPARNLPWRSGSINPRTVVSHDPEGRVTGSAIKAQWDELYPGFEDSRERIRLCHDLRNNENLVPLPEGYDDEASESLVCQMPDRQLLLLRQQQVLGRKRPRIGREPIGETIQAREDAEDLELWLNPAMKVLWDFKASVGLKLGDGEHGIVVLPSPTDWAKAPDFMETLDLASFQGMSDSERAEYHPMGPDGRYRRIARRYLRDRDGRAGDSRSRRGPFKADSRRSQRAYLDELNDYLARRLPIMVRLVPALNCLPLYGPGGELEGLVVRTLYTRNQLVARNYLWRDQKGLLQPTYEQAYGYGYGSGYANQLFLYELFGKTDDGRPYVAYSVGGMPTTRVVGGYEQEAVFDLSEWGIEELPCRYSYGMHFETNDWNNRGMPFMWPLAHALLNVENAMTSQLVYNRRTAWPPLGLEPDPNNPEAMLGPNQQLKTFSLPSGGGIVQLPGRLQQIMPPRMSDGTQWLVGTLMRAVERNEPDEAVFGGPGAQSGHQLTLSREYLEVANDAVLDGSREDTQWVASRVLECSRGLMRKHRVTIPVYANIEQTPKAEEESVRRQAILELNERWIGPITDVTAEYPKEGANLAEVQQAANLVDRGYKPMDDLLEMQGYEQPLRARAKIFNDKYYSPEGPGFVRIAELAARIRGDREEAEKLALIAAGRLQEGPGGAPTAALAGVPPPPGQVPGTALPNFGASALGGITQGALGTAARMNDARALANQPGGV